jgi:hypothetical protein
VSDILWHNDDGAPAIWTMDGTNVVSSSRKVSAVSAHWTDRWGSRNCQNGQQGPINQLQGHTSFLGPICESRLTRGVYVSSRSFDHASQRQLSRCWGENSGCDIVLPHAPSTAPSVSGKRGARLERERRGHHSL